MSHEKFNPDDIFINRTKTYPDLKFFIYDSKVIINSHKNLSGVNNSLALSTNTTGALSLYELNIDRVGLKGFGDTLHNVKEANWIFPFTVNQGSGGKVTFRNLIGNAIIGKRPEGTVCATDAYVGVLPGEIQSGSLPMSASIKRIYEVGSTAYSGFDPLCTPESTTLNINKHVDALQNVAKKYTALSKHFCFKGTLSGDAGGQLLSRDLTTLNPVNIINIPSIFYGSSLKKGSVKLEYYVTGTLIGRCTDHTLKGELVETVGPKAGSVVGIVMYDEGVMLLTASHALGNNTNIHYDQGSGQSNKWTYFGVGCNDGIFGTATNHIASASFGISCKGTSYVNTMTLFCHAHKNKLNYSNNPTFIDIASGGNSIYSYSTSSYSYSESPLPLKNIVSSSFTNYSSSYKKTTYLSKIGIYDEGGNLIMIASMAKPIKKKVEDEYTFKLSLDI